MTKSLVEVKVWGQYACFTRPEFKVERVSYPIITPSAAVGVLEAIYWKPQFRWHISDIAILPHPDLEQPDEAAFENYMPITLNELAPERVQRTCLVLRWPCYRIRADAEIFCSTTNPPAIQRQFMERVEKGQCFHQPYFGIRQLTACFGPVDVEPRTEINREMGRILHSAALPVGAQRVQYRFVNCSIKEGVFTVGRPGGAA